MKKRGDSLERERERWLLLIISTMVAELLADLYVMHNHCFYRPLYCPLDERTRTAQKASQLGTTYLPTYLRLFLCSTSGRRYYL